MNDYSRQPIVPFSVETYEWPAFQGRRPFDHQRATVAGLIKNKRFLVLNDMGTGKTLSVVWACDILMSANKTRRHLIVGPLSTMHSVWVNEIMMNVPHRTVAVAHGTRARRLAAIKSQANFVIINHDGIKIMEDELIDEQFDVIVIDELTAFKANSERTKSMKRICDAQDVAKNRKRQRDGGVWGLTGDMTPNSPVEAFYQCQIVVPHNKFLPRYYGQFRDACMTQVNEMTWIPKEIAPNVVAMVAQPSIRFTRDQCLDLPDTTYQTIEVPLTPEQQGYYDKMRRDAMVEASNGLITASNAAVKLNKLLQISAGAVKNDEAEAIEIDCKPRLDMLVEIFEQSPQKKLVVFATFKATIQMLVRELNARRIKTAAIYGEVPQNQRSSIIDSFQNGDLQIIVLQPQSAAHGITLTAASTMVWFSLIPSNELFQQGCARIVRAGQRLKTLIISFVSTSAERHIANILERKGDLSKETLALFTGDLL
jgi:SNF2 family DNA or RNA helicase